MSNSYRHFGQQSAKNALKFKNQRIDHENRRLAQNAYITLAQQLERATNKTDTSIQTALNYRRRATQILTAQGVYKATEDDKAAIARIRNQKATTRRETTHHTNDTKGNWKTKFSHNEYLAHKHATGDGQCFYGATFLAILDRAKKGLPLSDKFKTNFIAKLREVESTAVFQAYVGKNHAGLANDVINFDSLAGIASDLSNLRTLEKIGGYVLRQMAHWAHCKKKNILSRDGYQPPTLWGGSEQDRLTLEEVTEIQIETYTVTGAATTPQLTLDEASTYAHDAHKPSVRIVFNKMSVNSEENNHYDWLEITDRPQIARKGSSAITEENLTVLISNLPENYYNESAHMVRNNHANRVSKATCDFYYAQLETSEGTKTQELIGIRKQLQTTLRTLKGDKPETQMQRKITTAKISGITNALSMYAMHIEYQTLQARAEAEAQPAAQAMTEGHHITTPPTAVAFAGGDEHVTVDVAGGDGHVTDEEEMDVLEDEAGSQISTAPSEQAKKRDGTPVKFDADELRASSIDEEEYDEDEPALTDTEDNAPPAKRTKQSTGSIIEQLAAYTNVSIKDFQQKSTLEQQSEAVRHYAQGDADRYIAAFTQLTKEAAGEEAADQSLIEAIQIQHDLDQGIEPEAHPFTPK